MTLDPVVPIPVGNYLSWIPASELMPSQKNEVVFDATPIRHRLPRRPLPWPRNNAQNRELKNYGIRSEVQFRQIVSVACRQLYLESTSKFRKEAGLFAYR